MSVLYIRDKATGRFVPIHTIQGARGPMGFVDGLEYYENAPKALGNASPGNLNLVARGDHVHPKPTPADIGAATQAEAAAAMAKAQEALDAANTRQGNKIQEYVETIGWKGASPYRYEMFIQGITENDTFIMDLIASDDPATAGNEEESYGNIYKVVTSANLITLYAHQKPTVRLNVQFMSI